MLKQHPKALPYLFLTEMWERFGFYTVQGLLVLYMTGYFGYSDNESYAILGVFTALVYISPLIGGLLASHYLGYRTAIVWGGLFLVLGYFCLALPYAALLFFPALSLIIVGNGLFKPNVSSLLGAQYDLNDPRRDAGFTLFYIGINVGVFLAGLSSGYIKNLFGWQASFGLGSVGLLIGLATFRYGWKDLRNGHPANISAAFKWQLFFYCLLGAVVVNFLLNINALANWLLPALGVVLLVFLIFLTLRQEKANRQRLIVLNILILSSIVFWMLFLQLFNSANLYIERLVDKNFLGIPLTTTIFYASESIFIILLGPLFAWLWHALAKHQQNPSPIGKFALGILFVGIGFLVLSISTQYPNSQGMIHSLWIFVAYFFITIGELLLSPIGLSAVTRLAPTHLVGMMMGVWFVATGFGGIFAGWAAKLSSVPSGEQSTATKLAIYQHAFIDYAYFAFGVAVILFLLNIAMRKYQSTMCSEEM